MDKPTLAVIIGMGSWVPHLALVDIFLAVCYSNIAVRNRLSKHPRPFTLGLDVEGRIPRITITDVARRAKVSESTISRVFSSNSVRMRPATREMVLGAIEALNYRPSSLARSLVSKRTCTIGLLICDDSNPFYAKVIHGVESVALDRGYAIYLFITGCGLARGLAFANVRIRSTEFLRDGEGNGRGLGREGWRRWS